MKQRLFAYFKNTFCVLRFFTYIYLSLHQDFLLSPITQHFLSPEHTIVSQQRRIDIAIYRTSSELLRLNFDVDTVTGRRSSLIATNEIDCNGHATPTLADVNLLLLHAFRCSNSSVVAVI